MNLAEITGFIMGQTDNEEGFVTNQMEVYVYGKPVRNVSVQDGKIILEVSGEKDNL